MSTNGTGDPFPQRYCMLCGRPEHGTNGCDIRYSVQSFEPNDYWPWPKDTRFRVMDDRLFIVDSGSPPPEE